MHFSAKHIFYQRELLIEDHGELEQGELGADVCYLSANRNKVSRSYFGSVCMCL
jgi:hypothetical protein